MELGRFKLDNMYDESIENNYVMYKHTSPNGKVYIGMSSNINKRYGKNGIYYRNCIKFYRAIQKYGWENIKHEILFDGLTKEEAEQKEIELIKFYNSNNEQYGYNIQNGGFCKGKMSKETKNKISNSLKKYIKANHEKIYDRIKNMITANKGKKFSKEHIQYLKENHKGMLGKHHTQETKNKISMLNKGRVFTPEHIKKLHLSHLGQMCGNQKKIIQLDENNKVIAQYLSIKEASIATGINYYHISNKLRGVVKNGNDIWKYAENR